MHGPAFLNELLVVFGVALLVVLVLTRFRLPTIAGFIVAGAVLGPGGLRLADDSAHIEALAEVGVVLLLFTIGLEFSLARLKRLWKLLAIGGGMQVGLTVAGVLGLALLLGESIERGVFFGFLVAMSSTAIVLRALTERRELDAPHGRLIVGALVFQDLCIVPMMLVVPMLAGRGGGAGDIAIALAKAAAIVVGTLLLARLVVPRLLAFVAAARRRELFLLSVLLLCTGIAWLTSLAGLSLALGAFLAGMALADSEYGHQAMADVLPFRETLASLFFISVGMLFDPDVIVAKPMLVAGIVGAVLVGKAVVASAAAALMRFPLRPAILAGVGLAQIGEFSFVLANVGRGVGLLSADEQRLFVVMSVITMIVTPIAARLAPHLAAGASRLQRLTHLLGAESVERSQPFHRPLSGHVVVAGYGVAGRLLADALAVAEIPYIIVEINPESVKAARARGANAYYGDITSPEILEHAGLGRARELVILINDPDAARRAIVAARRHAPHVPILVRTKYVLEVEGLRALGAADVVTEEFEAGIEIMARVLRASGVPRNVIHERIEDARRHGLGSDRPVTVPRRMLGEIHELRELKIDTFLVREGHWIHGHTLAEFYLVITGRALVVALGRAGQTITNPRPFETIAAADVLYLVGDGPQVAEAVALLDAGPPGGGESDATT